MEAGASVFLRTFNDSDQAPPGCKEAENYWRLIGQSGLVLGFDTSLRRFLVQFDCCVEEFGLHCHNPEPNCLCVLESDLAPLRDAKISSE